MTIKKLISGVMFVLVFFCLCSQSSLAQQKKGDKEVQAFASGFNFQWVGSSRPRSLEGASGSFTSSSSSQGFSLGGSLGYFLTRRNELGGGVSLSVVRFRSCTTSFNNGQITGESCGSDSNGSLGLIAFYRYNFGKADAKGFPFVGASIGVGNVTRNFTGNVLARPHVGYKYFLKRNVALDFSVGYSVQLNKGDEDRSFFIRDRLSTIDGQLALSFVF
ncbi:MAG: hypothetical protein AABN34_04695 [Acidobacteriota bacterium]